MDWCQNGSFKSTDALCTDEEELDLKRVDKPRPIERCKSCDVRSQPKSGMNIPESLVLDPHSHPTVSKGWEALMRSLVHFLGPRVGTIAVLDSSDEKINYDQGVYGYPIEIQALFFMALRCGLILLKEDAEGEDFPERIAKRLHALSYHLRSYFWLDLKQLNDVYMQLFCGFLLLPLSRQDDLTLQNVPLEIAETKLLKDNIMM